MRARLAVLIPVLFATPALPCERGTVTGRVTHVRDGDTLELGALAIRLQGLAAPERNDPGGVAAREAMTLLALGKTVRCELDGTRAHHRCAGV
jgi:micrococcal nuclease